MPHSSFSSDDGPPDCLRIVPLTQALPIPSIQCPDRQPLQTNTALEAENGAFFIWHIGFARLSSQRSHVSFGCRKRTLLPVPVLTVTGTQHQFGRRRDSVSVFDTSPKTRIATYWFKHKVRPFYAVSISLRW